MKNLTVSADVEGNEKVGGIAGENQGIIVGMLNGARGSITPVDRMNVECKWGDAKVSQCYNLAYIKGNDYVGALVGYMDGWQIVDYCYNNSETPDAEGGSNFGKLVGGYKKNISYEDYYGNTRSCDMINITRCLFSNYNFYPTGWDPTNNYFTVFIDSVFETPSNHLGKHAPSYHYFTNEGLKNISKLDSLDWKDYGTDSIINTVCNHKHLGSGSIILCHNGAKYTPAALETMITTLQGQGYEFVPISELVLPGKYKVDYDCDHEGRQVCGCEELLLDFIYYIRYHKIVLCEFARRII